MKVIGVKIRVITSATSDVGCLTKSLKGEEEEEEEEGEEEEEEEEEKR